jgi:hypothetical protein
MSYPLIIIAIFAIPPIVIILAAIVGKCCLFFNRVGDRSRDEEMVPMVSRPRVDV